MQLSLSELPLYPRHFSKPTRSLFTKEDNGTLCDYVVKNRHKNYSLFHVVSVINDKFFPLSNVLRQSHVTKIDKP